MFRVSLREASLASTSTPPLFATANTDLEEPKSIPTAPIYNGTDIELFSKERRIK